MSAGSVEVTVPVVTPRNSYIVVRAYFILASIFVLSRDTYSTALTVIGDSGDASEPFNITAGY